MPKSPCLALVGGMLLLAPAVLAPSAIADGLPLPVEDAQSGVLSPSGSIRYVTAKAGGHTAVLAQDARTGAVRRPASLLRGTFTVPLVAYDGTSSGISANGTTLVLIRPRRGFPRAHTSFAVMDTNPRGRARPRLRRTVRLKGDFSFDALSADGHSLFLIQYISRSDPSIYRVRVYDLKAGRLAPKAIVDPRESPDEMNGYPLSRATSPGGRWAYTLYEGTEHPFIHALDTEARRAVCIDLHDRTLAHDPWGLRLQMSRGGKSVNVLRKRSPLAMVDTRTFRVARPSRPSPGQGAPLLKLGLLATCLLAAGGVVLWRRRRRSAGGASTSPAWPPVPEPGEPLAEPNPERGPERLARR